MTTHATGQNDGITPSEAWKIAAKGKAITSPADLPFGQRVIACRPGQNAVIGTLLPSTSQLRHQYREPVVRVVQEGTQPQVRIFRLQNLTGNNNRPQSVFALLPAA